MASSPVQAQHGHPPGITTQSLQAHVEVAAKTSSHLDTSLNDAGQVARWTENIKILLFLNNHI